MTKTNTNFENNVKVNHIKKEIIISKSFAKASSKPSSEACEYLMELIAQFPNYELMERTTEKKSSDSKVTYNGLTVTKMLAFMMLKKSEDDFNNFKNIVALYADEKGKYASIKRNFLNKYKNEYNKLSENDMLTLDNATVELKNLALKATDITYNCLDNAA